VINDVRSHHTTFSLAQSTGGGTDQTFEDLAPGEDNVELWIDEQDAKIIRAAFARLNEQQTEIALMYYVEKKTMRAIALELGCTHQNIGLHIGKIKSIFGSVLADVYTQENAA
jgi:DNA-directed RNA polymerase specialized sigma24 family protein